MRTRGTASATRSGEDSLAYLRSEFVTIPTPTQRTGQTVNHAMRVGRIQSALQLESAIYTVPTPTFERIRIIYNIERSDAFRELMDETGKPRTGL